MAEKVSVLISEEEVTRRVKELGAIISKDYEGKQLHLVCVLKGGAYFMIELAKYITVPVVIDFMSVSSYGSGTKSAGVYLVSPEVAVASAINGYITDPRKLRVMPKIKMPDTFLINDNAVYPPLSFEEAKNASVKRGPNIKKLPDFLPLSDSISASLTLKVGDNITTDHIMPAGAKILPYRSNIPLLSQFCFSVVDASFPERAKKQSSNIIVGGANYGQGSSREHAALVPLYLGVRAVIAKSFARIHCANLINAGILPLVFANPDDYEKLDENDTLLLENVIEGLSLGRITLLCVNKGIKIELIADFSERQRNMLLAGGLLMYTVKSKKEN